MAESLAVQLGEIMERMASHAVRDEDLPRRYRYKCLACNDLGVEVCRSPLDGDKDRTAARPCTHCPAGENVLAKWKKHVYSELSDEEIAWSLTLTCAHQPLPGKYTQTALPRETVE